jgi:WD40 repeat protein
MVAKGRTPFSRVIILVPFLVVPGLMITVAPLLPRDRPEEQEGFILGKHRYPVHCLAFAPDGKMLASGGGLVHVAGEIKLWDLLTGAERATLRGNQESVCAVAFSPDGHTLVTVSLDQVVRVWDVSTGRERGHMPISFPSSGCTVTAAGSQLLALAGWREDPTTVLLWRITPELEHRLSSGAGPVRFSADGSITALTVRVGNGVIASQSGSAKAANLQHPGVPPADDQRLVLTGRHPDLLAMDLWEVPLGREMLSLRGDRSLVCTLALSPDGRTLATGGFEEGVKLWDVGSGQERTTLWGHTDQVDASAFAPDGHWLASGSHDKTVRLWDPVTGLELATLRGHGGAVTCVAFAPGGQWLVSGSYDKTVRLWSLPKDL